LRFPRSLGDSIGGMPIGRAFPANTATEEPHQYSLGVSNSGVSRGIHHKCNHPLNPTRLYVPNELSRVLVYWFESHNMLECFMYCWLCKCIRLHDEIILCSSLPYFYCGVFCCVVLYFAMIINLLMWAYGRNTRDQQGGDGFTT